MGFWDRLLGGSEDDRRMEHDLREQLAHSLVGMGASVMEAVALAETCIATAKEEARKAGTLRLPSNSGDRLLEQEPTDPNLAREFQNKRREGVTDEDIRRYWNMRDLERRALEQMYRGILYATWKAARAEGRSDEEAARHARKFHAYWGVPDDTRVTRDDDRPLPLELMKREDAWFTKERATNPEELKQRMARSTSYNALIREEIRAGHL